MIKMKYDSRYNSRLQDFALKTEIPINQSINLYNVLVIFYRLICFINVFE